MGHALHWVLFVIDGLTRTTSEHTGLCLCMLDGLAISFVECLKAMAHSCLILAQRVKNLVSWTVMCRSLYFLTHSTFHAFSVCRHNCVQPGAFLAHRHEHTCMPTLRRM